MRAGLYGEDFIFLISLIFQLSQLVEMKNYRGKFLHKNSSHGPLPPPVRSRKNFRPPPTPTLLPNE